MSSPVAVMSAPAAGPSRHMSGDAGIKHLQQQQQQQAFRQQQPPVRHLSGDQVQINMFSFLTLCPYL